MTEKLQNLKNVTVLEQSLTIKSALHKSDTESLEAFANAIIEA
jgi:hypothetical protein